MLVHEKNYYCVKLVAKQRFANQLKQNACII